MCEVIFFVSHGEPFHQVHMVCDHKSTDVQGFSFAKSSDDKRQGRRYRMWAVIPAFWSKRWELCPRIYTTFTISAWRYVDSYCVDCETCIFPKLDFVQKWAFCGLSSKVEDQLCTTSLLPFRIHSFFRKGYWPRDLIESEKACKTIGHLGNVRGVRLKAKV